MGTEDKLPRSRIDVDPASDELARLRAENEALKAELDEARQGNLRYLQNVAHQLTAPLNAIKWNIEAIRDPEVGLPRKSKILSSIYSQGTILVHLIKNFTLMSNLEADHELGQFREQPEPVDALKLCINLANDFQPQAAELGGKSISVDELSFAKALGGKRVRMVKNLIAQAVSNLLENAVKYSDLRTTIYVRASRESVRNRPAVVISVVSSGLPISNVETNKLFERGFRGSAARQKVPAGTGIGLYLANRVMKIHHGAMGLRTTGRQSEFRLVFPLSSLV